MRRVLSIIIAAGVLTYCKDAAAPEPDEPGDPTAVAGTWTYFEQIGNTQLQIICYDNGTLAISQNAHELTGTVTQFGICTGPGGEADNSGTGAFAGNVGAATVRLDMGGCDYRGDLFNTPRDSSTGTVSCRINVGPPYGTVDFTGTWLAIKGTEILPPTVTGTITIPAGDTLLVTGETVRIIYSASDDWKLHWIGYRIGAPANVRDSVAFTGTSYSDTVDLVVPTNSEWASTVTLFARDAFDHYNEFSPGHVRVLDAVRRPYQTQLLGSRAVDMAYDAARNVIYLAESDSARVAVLSLASFTLGTPIPVPMPASGSFTMGIDIVPGGDTVVVALPGTTRLALLDRLDNTVDTVHIDSIDGLSDVRVTSSRKALVAGSGSGGGFSFYGLWEHDLATGTTTRRTDVGIGGNVNAFTTLVRSPDQTKVLFTDLGTACGYVYDAAAGAFGTCSQFGFSANALGTGSTTGNRWLVGNKLVDSSLAVLATVPGIGPDDNVGMAPDGSVAYRPTAYGYDKIALPAGTVVQRVRIPLNVTRISVLPEGTRLFLWSDPIGTPPYRGTNRATIVTP